MAKRYYSVNGKLALSGGKAIYTITKDFIKYGLLYNWYAATNVKKISSSDNWITPSKTDVAILVSLLDPDGTYNDNDAGKYIMETGTTYWDTPNSGSTNTTKFNARGGGYRVASTGIFGAITLSSLYWNSDGFGSSGTISRLTSNTYIFNTSISGITVSINRAQGCSIRLLKISTTLTSGQTGTYTGNDGKIYRTICIGTQEWLADNLAETKYRDGSTIPEITDNTAWSGLTTGALCAYNNDWNNV